jgi:hypothetical protein
VSLRDFVDRLRGLAEIMELDVVHVDTYSQQLFLAYGEDLDKLFQEG